MGSFGISGSNITGRKKKKIPQITHLAASSSEEAAQTLAPASSEQGLTREAQAAFLGWGLGLNALRTI